MQGKGWLFYSKNDKRSVNLFEEINIDWDKYFHLISVDKSSVRNLIKKSKVIRVNRVPCILVEVNDKILKYEDSPSKVVVKDWILYNILNITPKKEAQSPIQPKQEPHPPKLSRLDPRSDPRLEKLDPRLEQKLDRGIEQKLDRGVDSKLVTGLPTSSSLSDKDVTPILDLEEDDLRKASRTNVDIEEGTGHEIMAHSSLNDSGPILPKNTGNETMKGILQKAREMQELHGLENSGPTY